ARGTFRSVAERPARGVSRPASGPRQTGLAAHLARFRYALAPSSHRATQPAGVGEFRYRPASGPRETRLAAHLTRFRYGSPLRSSAYWPARRRPPGPDMRSVVTHSNSRHGAAAWPENGSASRAGGWWRATTGRHRVRPSHTRARRGRRTRGR